MNFVLRISCESLNKPVDVVNSDGGTGCGSLT